MQDLIKNKPQTVTPFDILALEQEDLRRGAPGLKNNKSLAKTNYIESHQELINSLTLEQKKLHNIINQHLTEEKDVKKRLHFIAKLLKSHLKSIQRQLDPAFQALINSFSEEQQAIHARYTESVSGFKKIKIANREAFLIKKREEKAAKNAQSAVT